MWLVACNMGYATQFDSFLQEGLTADLERTKYRRAPKPHHGILSTPSPSILLMMAFSDICTLMDIFNYHVFAIYSWYLSIHTLGHVYPMGWTESTKDILLQNHSAHGSWCSGSSLRTHVSSSWTPIPVAGPMREGLSLGANGIWLSLILSLKTNFEPRCLLSTHVIEMSDQTHWASPLRRCGLHFPECAHWRWCHRELQWRQTTKRRGAQ